MKKGISPIIATVLLIAIAVALTSIVGPSIISFIKDQAETTTSKSGTEIQCSEAGIYARKTVYNTSSGELKFKVENTGYQELTDFRTDVVFDNGSSASYSFSGSNETLAAGSTRWFINDSVQSFNFDQLIIISGACPSAGRDVIDNSSVSFV